MSDDARVKIGNRLKDSREYLGISQEEAAKIAKIPRTAISLIESGQRKLDAVELMALARLYQRPMAYFTDSDYSLAIDNDIGIFARNFAEMSESDKKEILKFAEFLTLKSRN